VLAWPPMEVWVECRSEINASRALLFLVRTILLKRIGCPAESGSVPQGVSDKGELRNKNKEG